MTLVDSGRVAYSNPVRQSLFTFEDSRGGARPKAQAAADSLRCIYPHVQAEGLQLTVPMIGHPLTDAELSQVSPSPEPSAQAAVLCSQSSTECPWTTSGKFASDCPVWAQSSHF